MSNRRIELRPLSRSAADRALSVLATIPSAPAKAASTLAPSEGERRRVGAKRLNQSAAILALSVLTDSALEHYRGSFQNKAMYAPLAASALTLAASAAGATHPPRERHPAREAIYASAIGIGLAGFGFHLYNILKRPGRLSWINLFYAAPIGAPGALALAGLMGCGAERAGAEGGGRRRFPGTTLGRALAVLDAVGIAGAVGEAGLLHFRGAFQNPAMFAPISVPPIAAALLADAAARPGRSHRAARWALRVTALLGAMGAGFHAFGISRAMGGWRNWSQNVLNGPPLPAPPSFTGLALAGLAALALVEGAGDG